VIDRESCQYFGRGVCKTCEAFCEAKAIDYTQEDKLTDIDVGSVVLASGYEIIDPGIKKELGYGRFPNVISSMQFERLLSASGPHMGTVLRPSDLEHPKKIAFIQCVGSREIDRNYCSSVCCMYATKEAIITLEHAPDTKCTIFYIDLRAFGKGYEAYYSRAKELGIRYIRCRPSAVREDPTTNNLTLRFEDGDGTLTNEEFDLVVLSAGMQPSPASKRLADACGIALDRYGFAQTRELAPAATSRPGVFVAGVFSGPKDIPESVVDGSAAASRAMSFLAEARGTLVREKTYPPERDVTGQEPRIGVFVCHCGRNIGAVVDVKDVVSYARDLPNVVHAEDNLYTCSTDACERIKQMVLEHDLNRVVVASCTPRTHEPLFRDTVRQVGLNPYLFEMANIRDQCSWVHMHEPQKATKKAKDMVRIAVAKSRLLEPLYASYVNVNPRGLVLGGGLAGITAALELVKQGFETYLLEKSQTLGGNLRRVRYLLDAVDPQDKLDSLIAELTSYPQFHLFTGAEVTDFEGSVGNFKTTFTFQGQTNVIEHGAVIVATGADEYHPTKFLYGKHPAVITQLDLEEKLAAGQFDARSVVMLQCTGRELGYCSRVCCGQALKNALLIRETRPDTSVFIVYRDMRTYGFMEQRYREARERGVRFIRLAGDDDPHVSSPNGRVRMSLNDDVLKTTINLEADLLVLSTAIAPRPDTAALAQKLKLPLTQDGFFLEAHLKLRPVDFASEGIFLCGLAHGPKTADESIAQAMAAAARAATILSKERVEIQAAISQVVDENCDGCAYCVDPCPYRAITLIEYMKDGDVKKVVDTDPAKCQGCGVCQATCPKKGIFVRNFRTDQLAAMVEAALAE
jgi:heterodisulfide reductase subunit A